MLVLLLTLLPESAFCSINYRFSHLVISSSYSSTCSTCESSILFLFLFFIRLPSYRVPDEVSDNCVLSFFIFINDDHSFFADLRLNYNSSACFFLLFNFFDRLLEFCLHCSTTHTSAPHLVKSPCSSVILSGARFPPWILFHSYILLVFSLFSASNGESTCKAAASKLWFLLWRIQIIWRVSSRPLVATT